MPKKPTYAGNDSTYDSEYKSYLKSTDPYLTDEDIDFMAQLNLEDVKSVYKPPKPSISGTSVERPTKVISSDNSLLEMAKKLSEKKKAQQQAQQEPKLGNQFLDVAKDVTERKQKPKLPAQYVEGASQISPIQEAMKVEPEYEVTPFPEGVDMGEPSVGRQFKGYVKPLSEQVKPQPIMTTQQRDAVGVNMKVPQPSQGGLPSVTKPIEDNFMSTANKRFGQFKLEREPEMPIPVDMANQKQAQDISEYLKSKQPADLGTLMAKKELPKGTKRQIQAYANAFNENVRRKEEFVAQKASELLPDNEFEKAINRKDLETQDRGTLIAQKYGGDAENINRELRDYMNSPMFKVDALKYARNKGELNQGAQIALDAKAEELAGLPSKFQQTATKIMSDLQQVPIIGSSVVNAARGVEGLLRAPMEIASGIYSGLEAIQGAGEQLMANKKPNIYELFAQRNKENLKKVSNVVPDLRPEDRKDNKLAQFFGDLASSLGYIEGGVLSTQKIGSVFGAAREAAAAGTTGQEAIGLANAARLSGKTRTVADKTLQSIQDVLRTKGAIKTAEFLDNAAKNAVMMAPALIENNSQTYIDAGFSSEEAAEKAAQKSMINVLGLSLPGVLRSSETGAIKNILGKGAERKVKGALKQGIHFGGDMALIRSAERAFDKANGIETEINAAEEVKAGFHDIALGISLNLLSGGSGRRIISEKQRISIADAIENRQALNEDIERNKRNPQEIAAVNSLLNTLTPYYKEAKERGYDKQQSVAYATEVARYNQAQKKMQPLLDLMTTGKATAQQEAEYKKYKAAQLKAEKAIKQVIEKGTIYDNRYLTSNDILDIVREQSPNKELKPQQDLKLEFNAPYQANEVVVADFANDPEVIAAKKELEASGATQELLEKMVVDNTPVVGTGNEILDGKKVMAAAEMIGLETIEVLESKTIEEIKEEANEAAEGIVSGEKNKEGLDEVAAKALDEMAELYEQHLEKNEGDFFGAVQEVVKDGLERGYGKEEIINMVDRVDDAKPISAPNIERLVNEETLKAQGASGISELLRMESERLESEGGELVEGVVKETEQKIQPNDTENTKGLSSEVGEGKEPIKAEPIEGASGKEIEASGVLESEGKVEAVEDLLGVKEKPIEEVKAEPIEEKVVEQEKDLSDVERKHNRLASIKKAYNALTRAKKNNEKGNIMMRQMVALSAELGYQIGIKDDITRSIKILNSKGGDIKAISVKSKLPEPTKIELDRAKMLIDKGVAFYDGNVLNERVEFETLTRAEVDKAVKDIESGKMSVPAIKLVQELNEMYEKGRIPTIVGGGGNFTKRSYIELEDFVGIELPKELELTEKDLQYITENEAALAEEYDAWYEKLSDIEKLEHLNIINDAKEIKSTKTEIDTSRESEANVSNEKARTEPKAKEQELEESKSAFEKTLNLHKKKLEAKYESKKAKIEEEAKKVYEDKPEVQLLSENFKKILLKLKEAGEIEVRNIEDC